MKEYTTPIVKRQLGIMPTRPYKPVRNGQRLSTDVQCVEEQKLDDENLDFPIIALSVSWKSMSTVSDHLYTHIHMSQAITGQC